MVPGIQETLYNQTEDMLTLMTLEPETKDQLEELYKVLMAIRKMAFTTSRLMTRNDIFYAKTEFTTKATAEAFSATDPVDEAVAGSCYGP